jgi:hypothetical protein
MDSIASEPEESYLGRIEKARQMRAPYGPRGLRVPAAQRKLGKAVETHAERRVEDGGARAHVTARVGQRGAANRQRRAPPSRLLTQPGRLLVLARTRRAVEHAREDATHARRRAAEDAAGREPPRASRAARAALAVALLARGCLLLARGCLLLAAALGMRDVCGVRVVQQVEFVAPEHAEPRAGVKVAKRGGDGHEEVVEVVRQASFVCEHVRGGVVQVGDAPELHPQAAAVGGGGGGCLAGRRDGAVVGGLDGAGDEGDELHERRLHLLARLVRLLVEAEALVGVEGEHERRERVEDGWAEVLAKGEVRERQAVLVERPTSTNARLVVGARADGGRRNVQDADGSQPEDDVALESATAPVGKGGAPGAEARDDDR